VTISCSFVVECLLIVLFFFFFFCYRNIEERLKPKEYSPGNLIGFKIEEKNLTVFFDPRLIKHFL